MAPPRKPSSDSDDLFRARLDNIIDMRHELVRLAGAIDWAFFDDAYEAFYSCFPTFFSSRTVFVVSGLSVVISCPNSRAVTIRLTRIARPRVRYIRIRPGRPIPNRRRERVL